MTGGLVVACAALGAGLTLRRLPRRTVRVFADVEPRSHVTLVPRPRPYDWNEDDE